ncbi:MAG: efflux RND transporter periplasmic adaptor subunit [Bacteroidota bacterium]|nr:efflux RND transporter periplasmic adaptor subunit [Bacteroidota bacterium]
MFRKYFFLMIIPAVILFHACGHPDDHTNEASHDHEAVSVSMYTQQFELFMEYDPLVVGDTSGFIIHLTRLSDYKPLTGRAIILEVKGAENYRKQIENPSRPGIYLADYAPGKASENALIRISFQDENMREEFLVEDVEIFANEEELHAHHHEHAEEGDISFLKEQAWKTDFGIARVVKMPFFDILKVSGELQALPTASNRLIASSSGILEFSRENFLPGQKINKGEALFYIKPGGLAGRNIKTQYIQAKAAYEKAREDYERAKVLANDQIISGRELSATKAEFEQAEAEYRSISENFRQDGQVVNSPMDGVISRINISNGSFVSRGEMIAELLNTDQLILKADVPQSVSSRLPGLESANFKTSTADVTYRTDSLEGELFSIPGVTITENYYLPVFFKIRNPGDLVPGTYAEVFLKIDDGGEALLIPEKAIMESEGIHYVYVQEGGESYRRQDVTTGGNDGVMVHILSGLEPGDIVVTKGAYRIKLASMAGELPSHGHAH